MLIMSNVCAYSSFADLGSFSPIPDEGLTHRRERRRAKREITKPVPPASRSSSDYESDASERPTRLERGPKDTGKKPQRSLEKKRKKKPMAGVALMEKFSAKNIGQERITVGLSSFASTPEGWC